MARVYIGQTALQIRLNLNQNITDAYKRILIKYKKPNGVRGFWEADVLDPSIGLIAFNMDPNKDGFTDIGYWMVWAHIYFKDGSEIAGERVQIGVYQQGKTYVAFPYGQFSSVGEDTIMAQEAFEIIYNNSESALAATNVQDAIDEVKSDVDHVTIPDAAQISYNNSSSHLPAIDVQSAIDLIDQTIDRSLALVSSTDGTIYIDPNRTDNYVPTGNVLTPFKSIAAALINIPSGSSISLAPFTYFENVALPDGVSMFGTEPTFTIISGDISTGNYFTLLSNFTQRGRLTTFGTAVVSSVVVNGNVVVNGDFDSSDFSIFPTNGVPLTVNTGNCSLHFVRTTAIDNSSSIIQHGGVIQFSFCQANNNSPVNATIFSDGGIIRTISTTAINIGGGPSLNIDNDGSLISPNELTAVDFVGRIEAGDAYTIVELIHFAVPTTISGTNIILRPASFIAYDTSNTHLPLPNIDPGAPAFNTTVQTAIDFIWSSCKSGITNPVYTPIKAPELYVNTATNTLWIWTGTWHFVTLT